MVVSDLDALDIAAGRGAQSEKRIALGDWLSNISRGRDELPVIKKP
jgi:hypothetical protein